MRYFWLRIVLWLAMLCLLAFLVPSGAMLPSAFGEMVYPMYQPVSLEGPYAPIDAEESASAPDQEKFLADGKGYRDGSLNVQVETLRVYDTEIMIAYVQIADPSQLRTELARRFPSKAIAPADTLAARVKAAVAINGDYFIYHVSGIIYRRGKLLRNNPTPDYDALIIDENGDFTIVSPITAEAFAAFPKKIMHSFCFGPALVTNGKVTDTFTLIRHAPAKETQRIGIGQLGPLTYVIVTTEGPENVNSVGLTLPQFAELMGVLGAQNAYNLDGGSSSTLVLNGRKINALSSGKTRAVGDIIYFVTAVPDDE